MKDFKIDLDVTWTCLKVRKFVTKTEDLTSMQLWEEKVRGGKWEN